MIKWGILGCGNIADKFAQAVKLSGEGEIAACASRGPEARVREFAAKNNIPEYYNSYEKLLERGDVECVYVANTHNFHYETAKLALEHGKCVLCEKSFTSNGRQAAELADMAKKKGLLLMEAMWTRYLPGFKWAKAMVDSGELGKVLHVDAGYGFKVAFDENSRFYSKKLAGGALLDLGVYPLNYACAFLGTEPQKISAVSRRGVTGVDERLIINLEYNQEQTAVLQTTLHYNMEEGATVYCQKGKISFSGCPEPREIKLVYDDGHTVEFKHNPYDINGFVYEIKAFDELYLTGKKESGVLGLDESVRIMELLDEIRKIAGVVYPED